MSSSMSLEGGRRQSESSESTHSCHSINDILGLVKSIPAASPAESCRPEQPHVPAAEATGMTTPVMGAVAAGHKRSRRRRARTNYTPEQMEGLEKLFSDNRYPGIDDRETLSDAIDLSEARVQVWFQNRRARQRRGRTTAVDSTSSPKSSSPQASSRPNTKPATSLCPASSPDSSPFPSTSDISPSSSPPQYLKVCTQSCCVKPQYTTPHHLMQSGTQYPPQPPYTYYPWAAYQAAGYPLFTYGASPYFYDPTVPVASVSETPSPAHV